MVKSCWHGIVCWPVHACNVHDAERKHRETFRNALVRIIGTTLPTLQELYSSRESERAGKITPDPHISTLLFELLPSDRRYRALSTRTTRHRTVSSLRQSTHEHLTLNTEHTTLLYIIYSPHTYFFISNLHISVILLHCGASVTITNSSYV